MHAFVTGASGHIGFAVTRDLLAAGHTVTGLARSAASADKLRAAGATVVRGTLDDLDLLADAARAADGVIHLGYKHDLAFGGTPDGFHEAARHDVRVVEAIGAALAAQAAQPAQAAHGAAKPFVSTAGTAQLALFGDLGHAGTEADVLPGGPRVDAENAVIALAGQGVRSSVVRLPPTVHSSLDHSGFLPMLIAAARRNGFAAYVGDGQNLWPAVHTLDAARLYRLAFEKAAAGSRLHAVADQGVPMRHIAEAIGEGLGLSAKSVDEAEGAKLLGPLAGFTRLHNPTSSAQTRAWLDWAPRHAGLLDDLREGHYFAPTER